MRRVNASQVLGAPLYLVNEDWYNAWIAFTKQSFALLITSLTQAWAPTLVRVSGDKSVQGQLFQTDDGDLRCKFPSRLMLMSNHQVGVFQCLFDRVRLMSF
jgi:lysocardiolipin and lysophospholipid acyltransferase